MSKREFVKTLLSPILRECFAGVLGASYERDGDTESLYITYTDSPCEKYDITNKNNLGILTETFDAVRFGEV